MLVGLLVATAGLLLSPQRVPRVAPRPLLRATQPPVALATSNTTDAADALKRRTLDGDFVKIAAPAFVQFAAEPLARLIDMA